MENKELIEYLDQKFKAIDERFDKVDEQLDRLENKSMSKQVKKNIDSLNHDIEYLAGKLGKHEMILYRISKQ